MCDAGDKDDVLPYRQRGIAGIRAYGAFIAKYTPPILLHTYTNTLNVARKAVPI